MNVKEAQWSMCLWLACLDKSCTAAQKYILTNFKFEAQTAAPHFNQFIKTQAGQLISLRRLRHYFFGFIDFAPLILLAPE